MRELVPELHPRSAILVSAVVVLVIAMGLWAAGSPAGEQEASIMVRVGLPEGPAPAGPPVGELLLAPANGEGEPVRLRLDGAGEYRTKAPEGSRWTVHAVVEGYRAREESAIAGEEVAVLSLYPDGSAARAAR